MYIGTIKSDNGYIYVYLDDLDSMKSLIFWWLPNIIFDLILPRMMCVFEELQKASAVV